MATGNPAPPTDDLLEMAEYADSAARLMAVLSNRNRLLVLCILAEGECSVGQLLERVPLSQSALSQHLAVLRRDELVATRREAQTIYYSLHDTRAARVVELLHEMYCPSEPDDLS